MNAQHVSEATMRVRDVVYASLLRWEGQTITEAFARSEANNLGVAIVEALAQLAEESKPPPVRFPCTCKPGETSYACPSHGAAATMEEHARRVIK